MSRSRRKSKIRGITTAESEKKDKQEANRKYRRKTKQIVKNGDDEFPEIREMSDIWGFEKDGKIYDENMSDKNLRK